MKQSTTKILKMIVAVVAIFGLLASVVLPLSTLFTQ